MIKLRSTIFTAAALGLAVLAASCAATDVVAMYAASSFGKAAAPMGGALPDGEGYFSLTAPDGSRFRLAAALGGDIDAELDLDAGPFLAAGLDAGALASAGGGSWSLAGARLVGRFALAEPKPAAAPAASAAEALASVAKAARKRVGYHAPMKHYGVMLAEEAMVEWAADLKANDKDWVFALDPAFVRAAGADPAAVAGWVLAMVPVEGPGGAMVDKELLLKPFNL